MTQLTAEMIRQHPALAAFNEYIRENLHRAPNPEEILVSNTSPNDGIIQLSYVSNTNDVFVAQIDASRPTGALELRHGRLRARGTEWIEARPVAHNVTGACETIHALGGEEESGYTCPVTANPNSAIGPSLFRQRATWLGQWMGANWMGAELIGLAWKRRSLTLSTLRNIPRWLSPVQRLDPTLSAEARMTMISSGQGHLIEAVEVPFSSRIRFGAPVLAAGALTALSAEYGAGLIGLNSNYHDHERFALDIYSSYGAMLGISRLINRRNPGAALRPASLGAGLLTSALVDATLGQMYAEGSAERRALRVGGFFLPEIYRMAFGNRALAIAETRAGAGFARWGGRAMAAGFYADGAYMIWNHIAHSNSETGRDNLIYRRANQLEDAQRHPLAWAAHGIAELIAPSLTERYWVSGNYVDQARQEIQAQANASGEGARGLLRHALLMGPTGPSTDPNFYRELDLSWLRGDNTLRNIHRADGSELPVADVAEQFNDPEIYRRVIENSTPQQQVEYIQRQFRGYRLSANDVQEIMSRIALHHARRELQDLQYTAGPELRAFAECFDGSGALRSGSETALLGQVFTDTPVNTEQLLALRRVSLARHILELQGSDPTSTELASYVRVAREIGLADTEGHLIDREETRFAQASLESHPAAPAAVAPVRPSQSQILQGVMAYGAAHG